MWLRSKLLQEIRQYQTFQRLIFLYLSYYTYLFAQIITRALAVKTGHLSKYPAKISLPCFSH